MRGAGAGYSGTRRTWAGSSLATSRHALHLQVVLVDLSLVGLSTWGDSLQKAEFPPRHAPEDSLAPVLSALPSHLALGNRLAPMKSLDRGLPQEEKESEAEFKGSQSARLEKALRHPHGPPASQASRLGGTPAGVKGGRRQENSRANNSNRSCQQQSEKASPQSTELC